MVTVEECLTVVDWLWGFWTVGRDVWIQNPTRTEIWL